MNITRQQQLMSNIKRVISTILREVNHEDLHAIVVTSVLLSNDGRECRIMVSANDREIKLLNHYYRGEINQLFRKQYQRKVIPSLTFIKDSGDTERMESLLTQIEPPK